MEPCSSRYETIIFRKFAFLPSPPFFLFSFGYLFIHLTDRNGTSDPYIVFEQKEKELGKTAVIKKQLNPIWDLNVNGMFSFEALTTEPLMVEIYDWNLIMKHKLISRFSLDLATLFQMNQEVTASSIALY